MTGKCIGIRHEDKYELERRTPITPEHVAYLKEQHSLDVVVQSSAKRVFTAADYEHAGASCSDTLAACQTIFGVKEVPEHAFEEGKTYVFFSHVIKGQPYNMPMLKRMMEKRCNLIDYECIVDENNRRLIFFGRHAGLAGMINSLWSLGQRLIHLGMANNPFAAIRQANTYNSLNEAKQAVSDAGTLIRKNGLPDQLLPLTTGFTGYGNVSAGAQEIFDLLPFVEISPDELLNKEIFKKPFKDKLYKVVFREEHLAKPIQHNQTFNLQDYYQNPDAYTSDFNKYIPQLSVLMNCMYWDARYPRLITKDYLHKAFITGTPKLLIIGDITCDPHGSIEITHKGTEISDPVFVYNPDTRKPTMGFAGKGILVMAVDILPSELPREASESFSEALLPFVADIAEADFTLSFDALNLPLPIKRALILQKGALTPSYEYIKGYL